MAPVVKPPITLRPYQNEALGNISSFFLKAASIYRQLLVLATGLGKTVVFASLPAFLTAWLATYPKTHQKMLVLAHRDELIKQAADELRENNPGLFVEIEKAEKKASPMADIIVASVQSLQGARLAKLPPDEVRIVVIDEAHHSTSSSYTKILQHFGILPPDSFGPDKPTTGKVQDLSNWQRNRLAKWDLERPTNDTLLLGVTATPRRSDNVGLEAVFQDVIFSMGIREGIEGGYLSPLRAIRILSTTSLDTVSTVGGDFNQGELGDAVNNEDRNKLAVKAWIEHATGRRTIAFTPTVAHAEDLAAEFVRAGVKAVAVSGKTPPAMQALILKQFRTGQWDVLVNCMLYTEGFNEPTVSCILHTRPTKSSVLYQQITGRGTRLSPGKLDCLIIDVVDVTRRHSLLTAPELFGLPAGFDGKGEDLLAVAKKMDKAKETNPALQTADLRSLDELDMRVQEIDIWSAAIMSEVVASNAGMTWIQDGNDFRMSLPQTNGAAHEHIEIVTTPLGQHKITLHRQGKEHQLATATDTRQAFQLAESWVAEKRPSGAHLNKKDAPWRAEAPSPGQLTQARQLKIPPHVIQSAKTKGELSNLIELAKSRAPKPKFYL